MTEKRTVYFTFANVQLRTDKMNNALDTYQLLTITHKTTNLKKIGDYVVSIPEGEHLQDLLNSLKEQFGLDELLYVPTCNRVIYLFTGDVQISSEFIAEFFQTINPTLTPERIHEDVAYYFGEYAVNHLYSVASSIDSLVIGERQILGQIRESFETCNSQGLLDDHLRLLMRGTVKAAKRVYAQTRIGEKPISIVSLSMKKLLDAPHVNQNARILMVGAGQTNTLVTKFLTKYEFQNVAVFNRSIDRAQKLAQKFGGEFGNLDQLATYDKGFDVLIVCTGATEPVITKELYAQLLGNDMATKTVIDLAIPYNVAADVVTDFSLNYIEIDGLQLLAKENMSFREKEVTKAVKILTEEVVEFEDAFKQRQIEKAMREIPLKIKQVKSRAMDLVFKKEVEDLDESTKELMMRMLTYMEKKCISIPMIIAKDVMMNQEVA